MLNYGEEERAGEKIKGNWTNGSGKMEKKRQKEGERQNAMRRNREKNEDGEKEHGARERK